MNGNRIPPDRVTSADLAADLDTYRMLAQVALGGVARLTRLVPPENRT